MIYALIVPPVERKLTMLWLLLQIHEEARKFSYQTGVKVVVAYGGAPINQQVLYYFVLPFFPQLGWWCW